MIKEQFIKAFLEGVELSGEKPKETLIYNLLGIVFDLRKTVVGKDETIEFMNDVARDSGWSMTCRSCGESFEPDCELSEMHNAMVYCGKNQWCCP